MFNFTRKIYKFMLFLVASLKRMKILNKKLWLILAVQFCTKTTMMKLAKITKPTTSKTIIEFQISYITFLLFIHFHRFGNNNSKDVTSNHPSRKENLQHRFPRSRHSQMHDQNCNVSCLRVNICAELVVFKLRWRVLQSVEVFPLKLQDKNIASRLAMNFIMNQFIQFLLLLT